MAKKVLQKQMDNWSQKSFNNVLQDWKSDPHVGKDLKEGLDGVNDYSQVSFPTCLVRLFSTWMFHKQQVCRGILLFMQVLRTLEQLSDQVPYVYDICSNPNCAMVYRGEFAKDEKCPQCPEQTDRRHPNSQRAKRSCCTSA